MNITPATRTPRVPRLFLPAYLIALGLAFMLGRSTTLFASAEASSGASGTTAPMPREVTPRGPLAADERSVVETFERAAPSVVYINTRSLVRQRDPFWMRTYEREVEGTGSGFVWDSAGHIVTNHHVIAGASEATVTLASGESFTAALVGHAEDEDLAVLKIEAPPGLLTPVPVGTSEDLRVGQRVLAIGNPFGLDQTLTVGHLSALGRTITSRGGFTIYDVLQSDAAINPGNSGGPLLDSAGRLIGVNTAIRSSVNSSAGIGFAVPVDRVNTIVPWLIEKGTQRPPSIGYVPVAPSVARRLGVDRGVLVEGVFRESAAHKAGLLGTTASRRRGVQLGDIIVALDGTPVDDQMDLRRLLWAYEPADEVTLTLVRAGEEIEVTLALDPPGDPY